MDTRIGYPNEYLAGETDKEIASPLYATAVGLVMDGLQRKALDRAEHLEEKNPETSEPKEQIPIAESDHLEDEGTNQAFEAKKNQSIPEQPNQPAKPSRNVVEKWFDKLKDFLDNAE